MVKKRISTDRKMHRDEIIAERFLILVSGTYLGAVYESIPYGRVKTIERIIVSIINQGGTAGYPVPSGNNMNGDWKSGVFLLFMACP